MSCFISSRPHLSSNPLRGITNDSLHWLWRHYARHSFLSFLVTKLFNWKKPTLISALFSPTTVTGTVRKNTTFPGVPPPQGCPAVTMATWGPDLVLGWRWPSPLLRACQSPWGEPPCPWAGWWKRTGARPTSPTPWNQVPLGALEFVKSHRFYAPKVILLCSA